MQRLLRLLGFFILLVFSLNLAACVRNPDDQATPTIRVEQSPSPLTTENYPISPSPTAVTGVVVLLNPSGSDTQFVNTLQPVLSELSYQAGLELKILPSADNLPDAAEVRLVIAIPPDPGLADLTQAYPQIQFLAIGIPNLQPSSNLSLIAPQGKRPDQQGFIGGFLATVITPDWRVGVISQSNSPMDLAARNGFINGARFFCGLCRPAYPPFYQYPLFVELSSGSTLADQQASLDLLINSAVKTVFIYPVLEVSILEYLAERGVSIIGSFTPLQGIEERWVATVEIDFIEALRQAFPRLLGGEKGLVLDTPIAITHQNPELLSPGRQRLVEKIIADLTAGYIDTGVYPLTGEAR